MIFIYFYWFLSIYLDQFVKNKNCGFFINKDGLKHLSLSTCLKINSFIVSRLHVINNNTLMRWFLKTKFWCNFIVHLKSEFKCFKCLWVNHSKCFPKMVIWLLWTFDATHNLWIFQWLFLLKCKRDNMSHTHLLYNCFCDYFLKNTLKIF
jgi:hypothetical protein